MNLRRGIWLPAILAVLFFAGAAIAQDPHAGMPTGAPIGVDPGKIAVPPGTPPLPDIPEVPIALGFGADTHAVEATLAHPAKAESNSDAIINPYIVLLHYVEGKVERKYEHASAEERKEAIERVHAFAPIGFGIFVTLLLSLLVFIGTSTMERVPDGLQNFLEYVYELLEGYVIGIMGEKGRPFIPFIGSLFLYLLVGNLLGLVPQFESPTSNIGHNLALALITFVVIQVVGLYTQGFGYILHFGGDIWWLAPLNFVIHVVGELARPVSLTLRLFGNIRGEDITVCVLYYLCGLFPTWVLFQWVLIPFPMICLMAFTSLIQALVWTMLTMAYLEGALPHHAAHAAHDEAEHGESSETANAHA